MAPTSAASLGEVTVLFADLRGFTTFSERTDPAAVVTLLNTYFGGVVPVILGEGGTVIQFIGDAIMAVFNAPTLQDDHALRAARASLAFQRVVDRLAEGHPDWPRFRVGIATGPALVGNVGSDEVRSYSAIGDTVNLAARLESWAQVGHVVISSTTAERLSDVATLVPVGALELKGKTALVEAYELVDLVSETTAAAGTTSEAANDTSTAGGGAVTAGRQPHSTSGGHVRPGRDRRPRLR